MINVSGGIRGSENRFVMLAPTGSLLEHLGIKSVCK